MYISTQTLISCPQRAQLGQKPQQGGPWGLVFSFCPHFLSHSLAAILVTTQNSSWRVGGKVKNRHYLIYLVNCNLSPRVDSFFLRGSSGFFLKTDPINGVLSSWTCPSFSNWLLVISLSGSCFLWFTSFWVQLIFQAVLLARVSFQGDFTWISVCVEIRGGSHLAYRTRMTSLLNSTIMEFLPLLPLPAQGSWPVTHLYSPLVWARHKSLYTSNSREQVLSCDSLQATYICAHGRGKHRGQLHRSLKES